jgi:hypothetical protein
MRILIIEGEGIQIRIDEIKNIAKFLSFNNFKASSPSKSPTLFSFETIVGGVLGKIKLNNPSTNAAIPDKEKCF